MGGEPARAFKKYGSALLKLEPSVEKGDLKAIRPKLRKFELFAGAYRNQPAEFAKVSAIADKIIDAAESGKTDLLKAEYANLLKETNVKYLLRGAPIPKGSRIVDTSSSVAGTAKLTDVSEAWVLRACAVAFLTRLL